jgi:hypothetical protein
VGYEFFGLTNLRILDVMINTTVQIQNPKIRKSEKFVAQIRFSIYIPSKCSEPKPFYVLHLPHHIYVQHARGDTKNSIKTRR